MKKLGLLLLTAGISAIACFSAFAGEWKQDGTGYWYDNGDSTYQNNGWSWIDGKCYYFTQDGYCLINTTTPDGHQVDASGAWVIDGVVQIQERSGALKFTVPEGYQVEQQDESGTMYANYSQYTVIITYDWSLDQVVEELGADILAYSEEVMDEFVSDCIGAYSSKEHCSLSSGDWVRYQLPNGNFLDAPGTMIVYTRTYEQNAQIMIFLGFDSISATDAVMNASVR